MNDFFEKFQIHLGQEEYSKLIEKSQETIEFFSQGYYYDTSTIGTHEFESDQEIFIEGINFLSMCRHHFLPFFGMCSVFYAPSTQIIGLSRLKEIVQFVSRKLTMQEELTEEIFNILNQALKPKELKITLKAKHTCMMIKNLSSIEEITTTKRL